jgi:lipid II isoglutaminyl synthase (glutamine-hydrolysing)
MLKLRLTAAILAGKAAGYASRALRRGGGTTLPGVVARRVEPQTLSLLSARLRLGVVLVAGTNGKTTTARMLAACLAADGQRLLHNRAGANLVSGLTSTALAQSSALGAVAADAGLFEVDEAAFPQALRETRPRLVLLHNLFRDQLDRYGEVDTIAGQWRAALAQLPPESVVLLNADDPSIAGLREGLRARVSTYGLEDLRHASDSAAHVADAQFCARCGGRYQYEPRFYAHIGHYRCPQCGSARPQPDFRLTQLALTGASGAHLQIAGPRALGDLDFSLPIPGLYNALNALAAASAARLLGVPASTIQATLAEFSAAFGRIERIDAGGTPMLMALIKNPVGASETIRMLTSQSAGDLSMLILINDRHADGTDVSWLWDADFERLSGQIGRVVVGGTRAEDMAVRLKYAGVDPARITTEPDVAQALDLARGAAPAGATLYALPTYTAMLELRDHCARRGWVRPFWED